MKIKWDDTLSVGLEMIDEEHKTLISKINDVSEAISKGMGEAQVAQTIEFLRDYSKKHFSAEENIMETKKYPLTADHKAKHAEFISTIDEIEKDFTEDGATKQLAEAINNLLANWLKKHIRETDTKLARYIS
ncbi:MAG TPA: bacteriohemerythrin [Victivallales bacterium]|nr:bacteriohemerythrin [Victivallales bacterium]